MRPLIPEEHSHHHGLVQVVTDPDGSPLRVSPVDSVSTHDLTAARIHPLWSLYAAARKGVPTSVDKPYTGSGAGIQLPMRRPEDGRVLGASTRGWNSYVDAEHTLVKQQCRP